MNGIPEVLHFNSKYSKSLLSLSTAIFAFKWNVTLLNFYSNPFQELHFSKLLLSQRDLADGKISRDEYLTTSRQSLTALGEVEKHKAVLTQFPCG